MHERIGEMTDQTEKGPRPILVCTGNSLVKRRMFRYLKQLKDKEQFKNVNVQHDLTMLQRKEKRDERLLKSQQNAGVSSKDNKRGKVRTRSEDRKEKEEGPKRLRRDTAEGGLTVEDMEGVD